MKRLKNSKINMTIGFTKKYLVAYLLLLTMCLLTINCSRPNYDGEWNGTTSQDMKFSFTVKENKVTMIYIGYSWSGDCPSAPAAKGFIKSIRIKGNSFSMDDDSKIVGKFNSANIASGSFEENFSGGPGSRCSSTASGTWSATK